MAVGNKLLMFCFCLAAIATGALGMEPVAVISGVAGVQDGDGILFGDVEVRLQGIAAPELGDRFGHESYLALKRLAAGKVVRCELDGTTAGRSKRPVGTCFVGNLDLGRAQIEWGFARDCPRFSKGRYRDAENDAVRSGHDLSSIYKLPGYCE